MEKIVNSPEETKQLAGKIAVKLRVGDVLALYGDLGSGKTTFTQFLVEAVGIDSKVQSPTFILMRVYEREDAGALESITKVNHLDLYRLQTSAGLVDLDLEEFLTPAEGITVIEWPEIAEEYLPKNTIRINFEDLGEEKRKIYVQNLH